MRAFLAAAFVLALLPAAAGAQQPCHFALGFEAIADQIPAIVGRCLENEHFNTINGNAEQRTTAHHGQGGLLVWRKVDNWTAFTDGHRTWLNGPFGLQTRLNSDLFPWEYEPPPAPPPRPAPTAAQRSACFVDATNLLALARAYGLTPQNPAETQAEAERFCQDALVQNGERGFACFRFAYAQALLNVQARRSTGPGVFSQDYRALYSGCTGR